MFGMWFYPLMQRWPYSILHEFRGVDKSWNKTLRWAFFATWLARLALAKPVHNVPRTLGSSLEDRDWKLPSHGPPSKKKRILQPCQHWHRRVVPILYCWSYILYNMYAYYVYIYVIYICICYIYMYIYIYIYIPGWEKEGWPKVNRSDMEPDSLSRATERGHLSSPSTFISQWIY